MLSSRASATASVLEHPQAGTAELHPVDHRGEHHRREANSAQYPQKSHGYSGGPVWNQTGSISSTQVPPDGAGRIRNTPPRSSALSCMEATP